MKESDFCNKFIVSMRVKWPYMWYMKIHGHEMQQSSIPDYLFCINGRFVSIEFKVQRDNWISARPQQLRELNNIKNANGVSLLIAYDENRDKILVREKRFNNIALKKYVKMDWDFVLNSYEEAVELIWVRI